MSLYDYGQPPTCDNPFLGGPSLLNVCSANAYLYVALFNSIITTHPKIGNPCGRITPVKKPSLSYDFIVVGGGAAGSVVAARLSEVPTWKVLLLEAGPDEPAGAEIPSNLQLYLGTKLDWNYTTTGESYACLKQNGSCSWPRGKNLGGCTAHHGMAYHRGNPTNYRRWEQLGNTGWGPDDVLPYFWKGEDNREIGRVSSQYHVTGGPMTVERFPWQPKFAWAVLKAARETKLGVSEDLVGEQITGFTVAQTLSKDGVRQSTAAAYLRPVKDRKNLHIALGTLATKILMAGKKAKGVQYLLNGRYHDVFAKKEVIVSGGTVNSAHLLLLSGIGPKKDLKKLKVKSVVDLPGVGENLQNHVSYGIDFALNQTSVDEFNVDSADLYINNQTGPMSSTGMAQVTGILASNYTNSSDPDIQIFFAGYQAICPTGDRIADLAVKDTRQIVRFTSVNVQARSRGQLTLASKDPLVQPRITSNDLSNPEDVSIILQGIRAILKLAKSRVMQKYGLQMVPPDVPECSNYKVNSDDYWSCLIHWDTRPENHQAGTCKMGPTSDPMAVVDPTLKVYGVQGLRVADASIMPQQVAGNPVATINMIGERAADFIKQDYNARI